MNSDFTQASYLVEEVMASSRTLAERKSHTSSIHERLYATHTLSSKEKRLQTMEVRNELVARAGTIAESRRDTSSIHERLYTTHTLSSKEKRSQTMKVRNELAARAGTIAESRRDTSSIHDRLYTTHTLSSKEKRSQTMKVRNELAARRRNGRAPKEIGTIPASQATRLYNEGLRFKQKREETRKKVLDQRKAQEEDRMKAMNRKGKISIKRADKLYQRLSKKSSITRSE